MDAIQIPCCLCGTLIYPNAANQCPTCLAQQFNLEELLLKQNGGEPLTIHQCRRCRRFARTENHYEACEPESPQLMSLCLKHIPSLVRGHKTALKTTAKLHIVDAIWIWTEEHSMRLKLRVTLRTELEQVPLQQRVMVEFHVHWRQCGDCKREYTSRTWHALVQLRQKRDTSAPSRKGLAALEMALARNQAIRKHVLQIEASRQGLDFYFLTLAQAQHFGQSLQKLAPMRIKTSTKLVSTDPRNNSAHLKHTLTADMVPLCRDDLVLVAKGTGSKLSGRLGLVLKVWSRMQIIDASPQRVGMSMEQQTMDLSSQAYYKAGGEKSFPILQTPERMIRFVVLDVELCDAHEEEGVYQGPSSGISKYCMADVLVARESDMGVNDLTYSCVTHLGRLVQPGDICLGYDLESTALTLSIASPTGGGIVDLDQVLSSQYTLPDVILVKKVQGVEQTHTNKGEVDAKDDEEPVMQGSKRVSKRKLRRRRNRDRKQRELQESAERMGFLGNGGDGVSGDYDVDDAQPLGENDDLSAALAQDPDMVADLKAVEEELAVFEETVPQDDDAQDDDGDDVPVAGNDEKVNTPTEE